MFQKNLDISCTENIATEGHSHGNDPIACDFTAPVIRWVPA